MVYLQQSFYNYNFKYCFQVLIKISLLQQDLMGGCIHLLVHKIDYGTQIVLPLRAVHLHLTYRFPTVQLPERACQKPSPGQQIQFLSLCHKLLLQLPHYKNSISGTTTSHKPKLYITSMHLLSIGLPHGDIKCLFSCSILEERLPVFTQT